jgi:hypothetical protein
LTKQDFFTHLVLETLLEDIYSCLFISLASAVLMEGIGFALHIISELIFEKFLPHLNYDGKA